MEILRDFFEANIDHFVDIFYDHFFSQTAEIKQLFHNTVIGTQKREFKVTILTLVLNLEKIEKVDSYLMDLGVRHVCYNVTNEHYDLAKDSFIYAAKETYKAKWSEDLKINWEQIIDHVILKMKEGVESFECVS